MQTVIRKAFPLWGCEEEEQWLCDMAARGLVLTDVQTFRYTFAPSGPGVYTLRTDYLPRGRNHAESQRYIEEVTGTGAELITIRGQIAYFRKVKTAPDETVSPSPRRAAYYAAMIRNAAIWLMLSAVWILSGVLRLLTEKEPASLVLWGLLTGMWGLLLVFYTVSLIRLCQKRRALRPVPANPPV